MAQHIILEAIAMFRTSGLIEGPVDVTRAVAAFFHTRVRIGNSLPTMLLAAYLGIPLAASHNVPRPA